MTRRFILSALLSIALTGARGAVVTVAGGADASQPVMEHALHELRALTCADSVTAVITQADKDTTPDSYTIVRKGSGVTLSSPSAHGLLYGALHLAERPVLTDTVINESPAYSLRILNHWDNLDGTVERGYAGRSIWKWSLLPDSVSPQCDEYGRRCAAVGINATVVNNVNASPHMLESATLLKVKAIADTLRGWGLRVFLSVNFATPMALGELATADPLDREVSDWWKRKADEIYSLIPDFGGFLVKANSEGEPGPMDFGRSHDQGANMLARALRPHGGIVMWRAFVYSPSGNDRAAQAYNEFKPLDGLFDPNVIIQIKNGPIDFQPREPHSPLFGAMPRTRQMVEFQITQEYLGHANHLVYLAPMWKEFFDAVDPSTLTAVAGVANVGDNANLTGHPMADANWWAFGRLAWNPRLSARDIADEWIHARLLHHDSARAEAATQVRDMLMDSYDAAVDYMMPLGLHHIFAFGHHYGPEPWCHVEGARPDWLPPYYHQADTVGVGFDRSATGSNAVGQYSGRFRELYGSVKLCPDNILLWFHHVPWTHRMHSGRTLWQELCHRYARGVSKTAEMAATWHGLQSHIDPATWADVSRRLAIQHRDARWWKDACLQYFSQFSRMPLTDEALPVTYPLDYLKSIRLPIDNYTSPSPALLDGILKVD